MAAPISGGHRFQLSAVGRIALLTAAMAVAAAVLFVMAARHLPGSHPALHLPWIVWAALFAVSEAVVVHVQWNRESNSLSASDLVMAAGLLLAVPSQVMTAQIVGTGVLLLYRRQRGIKLTFNVVCNALTATLTAFVYHSVVGLGGPQWAWLGALSGVMVATIATSVCIFVVMHLAEGSGSTARLREILEFPVLFSIGSAAIGVVLARSAANDLTGLALLSVPALLTVFSYRALTRSQAQQENMRLLHEITSLLHAGDDTQAALGDFLTAIRSAFRARLAELVLLGDAQQDEPTVSRSSDGIPPLVMSAAGDADEYAHLLRLATPTGTLRSQPKGGLAGQLEDYLAKRGFKDGIVAVLRTEQRVHGLLLIAGRLGDVTTFSDSDQTLLETFARHVATSLERGRLEETLRQVTDLKEQLKYQALHDPLTGLPNRSLFLDRVRQAVHLAARSQVWPAALFIDLDGFKPVNDTYGHDVGDLLLRTVADRLRGCLRPADTAARLGGDEFAIVLNGPIDRATAIRVMDRIRAALTVPVDLGDGRIATIGLSVGAAFGDHGVADGDDLLRRADVAMYQAKRAGGNQYLFYEHGLADLPGPHRDAAAELAAAVAHDELFVVYQPLVDMRTGRRVGAEALVRWQHPVDGLRTPETFIGLAEETGLIIDVGELVLDDACRQAARWVSAHPEDPDLLVTVNLSARQVADDRIVGQVHAALEAAGLEPRRLVLEITETVLMHDRDAAATTLWKLKGLGVRIAIDDFGTGYSSLAYLRRFPLDMLKVAREFVDGLGRDAHDDVITRAVIELAGALGLGTIAEGIETSDQYQQLAALGCDLAQGYLVSRPVDADAAFELIAGA